MEHRALVSVLLGSSLVLTACGSGGSDESGDTFTLRYATPITEGSLSGQAVEWFADELEERTDGRATLETFHDGSLMPTPDMLPSLESGQLDAAYVTPAYWPQQLPFYDITSSGFLTEDGPAVAKTVHELMQSNDDLLEEQENNGIHVVMPFFGSPAATGTSEPINGPEDLSGLRLRAAGMSGEAFDIANADTVSVPGPEIYEQIQRGVLDGYATWPFDIISSSRLYEVAPYTTDTGLGMYSHASLAFSSETWDQLPEDVRQTITEISEEYVTDHGEGELLDEETRNCEVLMEDGESLESWSSEAKEEFAEIAADEQTNSWREGVLNAGHEEDDADAFLDEYLTTYEQHAADSDYVHPIENCG